MQTDEEDAMPSWIDLVVFVAFIVIYNSKRISILHLSIYMIYYLHILYSPLELILKLDKSQLQNS